MGNGHPSLTRSLTIGESTFDLMGIGHPSLTRSLTIGGIKTLLVGNQNLTREKSKLNSCKFLQKINKIICEPEKKYKKTY